MNTSFFVPLIADWLVFPIVILASYALIRNVPNKQRYQTYCTILMAGLTSLLLAKLIATIYQPSVVRPFAELGVSPQAAYMNNPGFPSDHVLFTMAITLAVWFATKNKKIAIVLAVMTLLVALGRVLALVHTPTDVIGGLLIAFIGAIWYFQLPSKSKKTIKRN